MVIQVNFRFLIQFLSLPLFLLKIKKFIVQTFVFYETACKGPDQRL